MWETGSQVCITVEDVEGTAERVSTTYKDLAQRRPRSATGSWSTTASSRSPWCRSRAPTSSAWSSRAARSRTTRACRCPASPSACPALSDKDEEDLRFALHLSVDFIALSFVRSPAGRRAGPRHHAAGGHRGPGHRQAGEAGGGREPRGDRRRLRRDHGRPRRPRRGAAAGAGAAGAEAGHPGRPRAQQAGHRGHPDARVDDHELPADPRRGLRRRQRRPRRGRRGDALGGDLGRRAPDRRRPHDGADHRGRRDRHRGACR